MTNAEAILALQRAERLVFEDFEKLSYKEVVRINLCLVKLSDFTRRISEEKDLEERNKLIKRRSELLSELYPKP
jgi:hypothetical protein